MWFCCCNEKRAEPQLIEPLCEVQSVQVITSPRGGRPHEPDPEQPAGAGHRPGGTVTVLVAGARGLRDADWMPGSGRSDCFCSVEAAMGGGKFETPVIRNTLHPVWLHEGQLQGVPAGTTLVFSVWDKDTSGRDLLGNVTLRPELYERTGFSGELPLEDSGAGARAFLKVKVKVADQAYPPGPGPEFTVTMQKTEGSVLGLDVDLLDGETLHVSSIKAGMLDNHNKTAPDDCKVLPGVFIIGVNGVQGNAQLMVTRLKEDRTITLTLRRPSEFSIVATKKGGTLGMDLNYAPTGISLLVLKVNDGPVAEWNKANPDMQVKKFDRISAVNGVAGTSKELYEKMKSSDVLHLVISRPADASWWRWF